MLMKDSQGQNKKILFISSASPLNGPGAIGKRMYDLLKEHGVDVDMLTLEEIPQNPEILYIYGVKGIINRVKRFYRKYINGIKRRILFRSLRSGYNFFYRAETKPPVKISKVLKRIHKNYDLVIVYFWQDLMSFKTINDIYDRLHCKFLFICADYSPMSGGCHFTNQCERFKIGCGKCPAFGSTNSHDFTYKNILYRKAIYEKVQPVIWLNTYMKEYFFDKALLTKDVKKYKGPSSLNLSLYRPLSTAPIRDKYDIPSQKEFIIAFGCQSLNDERKGMTYMIEALNKVYDTMTQDEREKTMLLSIGKDGETLKEKLRLDYKCLGFIPITKLPEFYSLASVFVGSSVNDAGPSMYSQALACGTPLVAFEMGAALDVLRGKGTGYCAKLRDSDDLANGILYILRMREDEYDNLCRECIRFVKNRCSSKSFVDSVLSLIE